MTQLDPLVRDVLDKVIVWRQDGFGPAEFIAGQADDFTDQELALITAVDAMLAARHDLRDQPSKADLEFGSAEALRAEETSVAAALEMLDKANRRAKRFAEQLGDLGQGLRKRGIRVEPTGFVVAALDHIDRLTTALDGAARDAHVELEAVYDGGLSTDQEIRARALDAAARLGYIGGNPGDVTTTATHFEAYVRDGSKGEIQRHYEAGLEAGRRLAAIDGQRRYHDGYREAVLRLADDERYEAWRESIVNPSAHPDVAVRAHLATYLGRIAPDRDDPPRVSAEERSDDTKEVLRFDPKSGSVIMPEHW